MSLLWRDPAQTGLGVGKIEFCVDCVAFAPHRRMDVQDWGVDYAFFSFYKVFVYHILLPEQFVRFPVLRPPHLCALCPCCLSPLIVVAITHHFLRVDNVGHKLQPGGPGYELVHGAAGVPIYLRSTLEVAFAASAAQESALCDRLLAILQEYACTRSSLATPMMEACTYQQSASLSRIYVAESLSAHATKLARYAAMSLIPILLPCLMTLVADRNSKWSVLHVQYCGGIGPQN
jgi:hypothetical protein